MRQNTAGGDLDVQKIVESALRLLGIRLPVADFKGSVEAAYRRLAVKLHPDKGGSPAEFRLVKTARDVCVGDAEEGHVWSEGDAACRRLCADPRVSGANGCAAGGWGDDVELACSDRNLAKAKSEIANLRRQALMATWQREAQQRLEEERARRLAELQRQQRLDEEHARRLAERRREEQEERRARERRLREAELQRRRQADIERQARESLRAQQEETARRDGPASEPAAAEPEARDFKHYVPRVWAAMSPGQVKKKEEFLKKLRSLRTMRKRAQDRRQASRVASCNERIDAVLREAWALHREASGQGGDEAAAPAPG